MAMYTDLNLNLRLSLNMPEQLTAVLSNPEQLNDYNVKALAQYRFFRCVHCIQLLSFPLDDKTPATVLKKFPDQWEFTLQTTFLNYDNEFTHFMELLRPYIIAKDDELLGETKYCESWNYVEIWLRNGKPSYEVRDTHWFDELKWTLGYGGGFTTNSLFKKL